MKKNSFTFTQSTINNMPAPTTGRAYYYDSKEPLLELCITEKGYKGFNYFRWRKGSNRPDRIKIGDAKTLSVPYAREQARSIAVSIAQGNHPKQESLLKTTLNDFFPIYMERHNKQHKKSDKGDTETYNSKIVNSPLGNKTLLLITRQDILKLHYEIGSYAPYRANRVLALLSIMFNKAIEWGYCKENPCKNIKRFKEKSRERFLMRDEIPHFFYGLEFLKPKYKSYFLVLLFTGARSNNVKAMRWNELDFERKIWSIPDTKNGLSQVIPLSEFVIDLIKEQKGESKTWVFPSDSSSSGHLEEAKKHWNLVRRMSNLPDLRMHDLRRTLGSWQAINGVSLSIIGKSLNHKSANATQIYARLSIDPVREAMTQAQTSIIGYSRASHSLRDFLGWSLTNNHNITLKYRYLSQLTYLLSLQAYRLNRHHK